MSNQQPTAEKSVQTQELTGPTTVYVTNNPVTHLHTENTAAEVANTLVSMATGRQRGTAVKQLVNPSLFFSFIESTCHSLECLQCTNNSTDSSDSNSS